MQVKWRREIQQEQEEWVWGDGFVVGGDQCTLKFVPFWSAAHVLLWIGYEGQGL